MPSIELICPRFVTILRDSIGTMAADCGVNGGEVLGTASAKWTEQELIGTTVRLTVNGAEVAKGTGALVLGSPHNVLEWTVNDFSKRGIPLSAGQFVSTGTCTGIVTLKKGDRAVAEFGRFGTAEVTFV